MDKPTNNKWFSYRDNAQAKAELFELIKRSMRQQHTDEEIRDRIIATGLAMGGYMRVIDGLIVQARRETRIPDPSDHAAVAAAEPIKFMNMTGWDDEPPPPRIWAVRDRIPGRQVTLFSGEGGAGKSIVLLQLLCSTVLGRDWLGCLPEPGPAIYLGAEDEEDELHRRLDDIARHYGETFAEMIVNGLYAASYAGEDMTLARFDRNGNIQPTLRYDRLLEQACDIHPSIVVLDTLSDIFGGNENDRVQVSAFTGLVRKVAMQANCAVIVNAHPSLSGTNSGSGLSGSTAWHGKVRGRMYLHAAGNQDDPDLRVLEFKKNQYGRLSDSILLRYKDGMFVAEPRMGTVDQQIAEERAEQVFLSLLDRFTKEGRNVTDKPGTSYAPAMFGREMEAHDGKLDKDAMAAAMRRLFAGSKIRVVTEGPKSKQRSRIARA
ncbi:RecA-family ATPase [Bradyrhizobium sp. GM22.5]